MTGTRAAIKKIFRDKEPAIDSQTGRPVTYSRSLGQKQGGTVVATADTVKAGAAKIAFSDRIDRLRDGCRESGDIVYQGVLISTEEEEEDTSLWPTERQFIKAIKNGQKELVREFVAGGVDLDILDPETSLTPLMLACVYNHHELIPLLMDGSDLNTRLLRQFLLNQSGESMFQFGIVGQMREENGVVVFNWANEWGATSFLIEAEARWLLLTLGHHVHYTEKLLRESFDPSRVPSLSQIQPDFRLFLLPFIRNNGYLNHGCGLRILSIVDIVTIVTSDYPFVMALMWASIYQTKTNVDEMSDQVAGRAAFMMRVAKNMLSTRDVTQLAQLTIVPFVAKLIDETHAIEVTSSPRFYTFLELMWEGKRNRTEVLAESSLTQHIFPFVVFRSPWWSLLQESASMLVFLAVDMEIMYRMHGLNQCQTTASDESLPALMRVLYFFDADPCFNWRLILGIWFTLGSIVYEGSKLYLVGLQDYFGRSVWSAITIGCILFHALAWNSVVLNGRLALNKHFFGMAVLLLWLKILQILSIFSYDFGIMIHAVLQVMFILSRFIVLIFVFMVAFGSALFAIEDHEMKRVFHLSDESSFFQFSQEFLYALFVMTFNEDGVTELFQYSHDSRNAALMVSMTVFKIVVLLTLMDMVVGVMSQTWNEALTTTSRGKMMIDNMNSAKMFMQLPVPMLLPPPFNLVLLLLRIVTFPFDWIGNALLWRRLLMIVVIIQGFPLAAYTFLRYKTGTVAQTNNWNRPIFTILLGALLVILSPLIFVAILVKLWRCKNLDDVFSNCEITHLMTIRPLKFARWKRSQTQSLERVLLNRRSAELDSSSDYGKLDDEGQETSFENQFGDFVAGLEESMECTIERRSKQSWILTNFFAHCRFDTLDVGGDEKFSRSTLAPMYWDPSSNATKKKTTKIFADLLFDETIKTKLVRLGQMLLPSAKQGMKASPSYFPYSLQEDDRLQDFFPDPILKPSILEEWLRRFEAVDTDAWHDYYHFALLPLCVLLRGVDETVILDDSSPMHATMGMESENSGNKQFRPEGDFVPKGQVISKNIACIVKGAAADKEEHFLQQMRIEIGDMNEEVRAMKSLLQNTFEKDNFKKR